jgi:hypothetical protein
MTADEFARHQHICIPQAIRANSALHLAAPLKDIPINYESVIFGMFEPIRDPQEQSGACQRSSVLPDAPLVWPAPQQGASRLASAFTNHQGADLE